MQHTSYKAILGMLFTVLFAAACGSDGPSDKEVLISLTDEVVVPAYSAAAEDAGRLDRDVQNLCGSPTDPSLETARESWRKARASWMFSEAMWFGPVMERRSISILDWSPTNTAGIDQLLADNASVFLVQVREVLASNQRGFGAIEYILLLMML